MTWIALAHVYTIAGIALAIAAQTGWLAIATRHLGASIGSHLGSLGLLGLALIGGIAAGVISTSGAGASGDRRAAMPEDVLEALRLEELRREALRLDAPAAPLALACEQRDSLAAGLSQSDAETVVWRGLQAGGGLMVELFHASSGSWSIVVTDPKGCATLDRVGNAGWVPGPPPGQSS